MDFQGLLLDVISAPQTWLLVLGWVAAAAITLRLAVDSWGWLPKEFRWWCIPLLPIPTTSMIVTSYLNASLAATAYYATTPKDYAGLAVVGGVWLLIVGPWFLRKVSK